MRFFKKTDILIIVMVVLLAGGIYIFNTLTSHKGEALAEIYLGSQLMETIPLSKGEDRVFSLKEKPHVVFHLYADGSIAFQESDCPDKVCIETGPISVPGQSAACLPNQLILKIVPSDEDEDRENEVVI